MVYNELINQEMFFLLAGPCVIEGEEMALNIAEHVKKGSCNMSRNIRILNMHLSD